MGKRHRHSRPPAAVAGRSASWLRSSRLVLALSASPRSSQSLNRRAPRTTPQRPRRHRLERPVVLFIGDSYSAGRDRRHPPIVGQRSFPANSAGENNHALGGTGYLATSGVEGCGLDYCGTYGEVIASLTDIEPDIVVISGGRNDGTRLLTSADAVSTTVGAAIEKWPDATVVVPTPIWDDETPSAPQIIDVVRTAASGVGAQVLDLGQPLEGHPDWIIDDGVHPNDGARRHRGRVPVCLGRGRAELTLRAGGRRGRVFEVVGRDQWRDNRRHDALAAHSRMNMVRG